MIRGSTIEEMLRAYMCSLVSCQAKKSRGISKWKGYLYPPSCLGEWGEVAPLLSRFGFCGGGREKETWGRWLLLPLLLLLPPSPSIPSYSKPSSPNPSLSLFLCVLVRNVYRCYSSLVVTPTFLALPCPNTGLYIPYLFLNSSLFLFLLLILIHPSNPQLHFAYIYIYI